MSGRPILIYFLGDDGKIQSRPATPDEAERSIREHAKFARQISGDNTAAGETNNKETT